MLASSVLAAVSGLYHPFVGHAYGLKSAPCVNAANIPVPCAAGFYGKVVIFTYVYMGTCQHYLFQRDADAEPQLLVAAGVPFGSSTGLDPITQGLDPVTQVDIWQIYVNTPLLKVVCSLMASFIWTL